MKYLVLCIALAACSGRRGRAKTVYCLDLPEGTVTAMTYYSLGGWGTIEVIRPGLSASEPLTGQYWFKNLKIGDTITHDITKGTH